MDGFIRGMDISSLDEVERCGGRFSLNGHEGDVPEILRECGTNLIRLRLWHDPYSESGEPYGAGTCDLETVMALAARCRKADLPWMLDIHYSDFWVDPGKQFPPKAWKGYGVAELERAVYEYTLQTLCKLVSANLTPAMVQVGNETTNGLLWPAGKRTESASEDAAVTGDTSGDEAGSDGTDGDAAMTRLISSGIRAVREILPGVPVMIHLDNGGSNALYRDWFGSYFAHGGADFDIIGLSYYPFWHGTLDDLQKNMSDMAATYGKPMIVVETATAFTLEDFVMESSAVGVDRKPLLIDTELASHVPYDMTPEGQCDFLRDLCRVIRSVPGGLGYGFVWWEPAWIPVPGSGWGTRAGLDYIGSDALGGNEWANMSLFDYEGRALPALKKLGEF